MTRALAEWWPTPRCYVALEWKPQDLWIGAFWRASPIDGAQPAVITDVWICLLPCLPIHLSWERPAPKQVSQ